MAIYNIGQKLRHLGRHKQHHSRLVVTKKQIVDTSSQPAKYTENALVIYVDTLPTIDRDEVLILLNSGEGQQEEEFGTALYKKNNLYASLYQRGYVKAVPIDDIEMLPEPNQPVALKTIVNVLNKTRGLPQLSESVTIPAVQEIVEEEVPLELATTDSLTSVVPKKLTAEEKKAIAKGLMLQVKLLEDDMNKKLKEAYKLDPSLKQKATPKVKKA